MNLVGHLDSNQHEQKRLTNQKRNNGLIVLDNLFRRAEKHFPEMSL